MSSRILPGRRSSEIILIILMLFCGVTFTRGQSRGDSLRQDFILFRTILANSYPSFYRYATKEKLDKQFDDVYASINDETTELAFFKNIKFLLSAIKDGHLYCGPSPHLRQYMDEEAKLFPLNIQFIENKAYLRTASSYPMSVGAEIIAIDHQPIGEVKKTLFRYIVSDGNIETKKYHILNYAFRYYYLIAFGVHPDFEVTYKPEKGSLQTIKVNAVQGRDLPRDTANSDPPELLKLNFKDQIARLTIKTFDSVQLKDAKKDYTAFLQSSFEEINQRKIKKLIIDLRGNGGGRDLYGSLLYAYLTDRPFAYYKALTSATKSLPYEQFRSNHSSYNDLSAAMLDSIGVRRYRLKNIAHANLNTLQPSNSHFDGKVWFLTDGLSFSSTAEFCAIVRSNGRGKFIGEETGGAYCGNTSGTQIDTPLPNTKMMISFGTIEYEMAVRKTKNKGRGVIPDYIVTPTIGDIIHKKDSQLDFAMRVVNEK